ncbi:type II toxin-antitoxin system RelE/ParE family toxin [Candidatus Nitrospira salsa]|nr:MAG: hypothetical protein NPIRA01_24260 [Nitrospirales bacterium]
MLSYELTKDAEADLEEIIRYTTLTWGLEQAERYFKNLQRCFNKIGTRQDTRKSFHKHLPQAFVVPCEHHYVFYLLPKQSKPQIIAVFHERMDLMHRLKERFE